MDLSNSEYFQQTDQSSDQNIKLNSNHPSIKDWVKIPDFQRKYPSYSLPQLRWLLLRREQNGLSACVRRIGKPLYLNTRCFLNWIENHADH